MIIHLWSLVLAGVIASLIVGTAVGRLRTMIMVIIYICLTPLMFVWLLIDHRNLRRMAEDIEPPDAPTYQAKNIIDAALQLVLRRVFAPIIVLIALPCIVIVGGLSLLITGDKDRKNDNDTIW